MGETFKEEREGILRIKKSVGKRTVLPNALGSTVHIPGI
jgi:hypothetical protein